MEVKKSGNFDLVEWLMPLSLGLGIFLEFVQAVSTIENGSVIDFLTFVALPIFVWCLYAKSSKACKNKHFGSRFLLSVMAIAYITFIVKMSTICSVVLVIFQTLSTLALVLSFLRSSSSDPGFLPVGTPPPGGYITSQAQTPLTTKCCDDSECSAENPVSHSSELLPVSTLPSSNSSQDPISYSNLNSVVNPEAQTQTAPAVNSYPYSYYCYECHIWKWPRSKHCYKCARCVDRYDHHCPAIGTCVGRKNHPIFVLVVISFLLAEIAFVVSAVDCFAKKRSLATPAGAPNLFSHFSESVHSDPWVSGIAIFLGFQIVWEVPLLAFHLYGTCTNVTTNEFAKWYKIPYMYREVPSSQGQKYPEKQFVNPYNKGLLFNLKSFFSMSHAMEAASFSYSGV